MKRLVRGHRVYSRVVHRYESDFEPVVLEYLPRFAPGFHAVPFKAFVPSEDARRWKADLALVHEGYANWFVVEVELDHHSFEGHIYPQAAGLQHGEYGDRHADYLSRHLADFDRQLLSRMVDFVPPTILVVGNDAAKAGDWQALSDLQVELAFLEIFRAEDDDDVIVEYSGYVPTAQERVLGQVRSEPVLGGLQLIGSLAIPLASGDVVSVSCQNRQYSLQIIRAGDRTLMLPTGSLPSLKAGVYDLVGTPDDLSLVRK